MMGVKHSFSPQAAFNSWTVIQELQRRGSRGEMIWLCRCSCGKEKELMAGRVVSGKSQSCGCRKRRDTPYVGAKKTHGLSTSPEFNAWCHMIDRCYNSKHKQFRDYGERGISVCDRWRNSFEAFLADMGERPSDQHSIDRFPNNNGNYEPENCRWATRTEQARNMRTNRTLTFMNRTMTMTEWALEMGITKSALKGRLNKGMSVAEALTAPVRVRRRNA